MPTHKTAQAQLIAIRHCRVLTGAGLCYGQTEVPLATSYAEEKQALDQKLQKFCIQSIYTSPLLRCRILAEDLALGPVIADNRLKELNFGDWENRLWSEIPRHESEYWTQNIYESATPHGESFKDLIARVKLMLDSLIPPALGYSHLLVTHAGVIRALWHLLNALEPIACFEQEVVHGKIYSWSPWLL
ncbi:MAG: histidine phosphatase family protein [Proteobacteria bacterium]|nr:histidine phosphatase family protein [Pseudomonadota bacterium]